MSAIESLVRSFELTPRSIEKLPGETDLNYHVTTTDGTRYLLKIASNEAFDPSLILRHLATKELPFRVPEVIGHRQHSTDKGDSRASLYTWIPGTLLAEVSPRSPELYTSWGSCCGHLSKALADLDLPAAHRPYRWDPQYALTNTTIDYQFNIDQEKLAEYFLGRLETVNTSGLRQSVSYNDAHELNLLIDREQRISGVIDFGDAVYTATVCELAIACAYAGMNLKDPLAAMRRLIAAYHSVFPLHEKEVDVLYDLICTRLLTTVTVAVENALVEPDNKYLQVSAAPAWALLHQLRDIDPTLALAHFRTAAGFSAHPAWQRYHDWAATAELEPVMLLPESELVGLDLGVGSMMLGENRNFEDLPNFTKLIRRHLEDHNADIGTGGYGEIRPVYTTDDFQSIGNEGPRWRTLHLGLDLWTRDHNQPIVAPIDGTVHSCGPDPTAGGYGNTIILRHSPTPELTFYTLYGHLSSCSLENIKAGTQVQAGALLATVGKPEVNGGWPPHLHFQVMLDTLEKGTDFPGVAYVEEREVWLGLCPDPRTLIPQTIPAETVHPHSAENLTARRRHSLGYGLSVSYKRPLQILRGSKQYLYDDTGRRYLDTVNNVAHVGHEHPRIVRASRLQSGVLNTNTRYLHPTVLQFADRLTATLPTGLSVVHFVNSGSEANELALRMAAACTGNRETLAFEMGYHGNTQRTIEVSSYKFDRPGGGGKPATTHLLPLPDALRNTDLDPSDHLPDHRCSFIHETILSCGGQLPLPPGYLEKVYRHIHGKGGVCIADEVQTGLGRCGSHYWAFQSQSVVPDIVTIGKPIGNGHPIGAVVCTHAVAEAFNNGMEYFNTFGGNPVSSAIGLEVLKVVEDEGLMENAATTGGYLTGLLNQLQSDHPVIADVRGSGLFLGIELCGQNFAPASAPARYVKERMRELGFLMGTDGPHENVLKIKPPLCFSRANCDLLVDYLNGTLREDGSRLIG